MVLPRDQQELPTGVKTELIYRERLLLVAGPGIVTEDMMQDPSGQIVDLSRMAQLPFILLKKGHGIRKRADLVFKRHKVTPNIIMEVSSCISAVQLAASGLGITIVPQRAVDVLSGVEEFCCYQYAQLPEGWNVNVVYREDAYLDRAERCFIDLMKDVFGKEDGKEEKQ